MRAQRGDATLRAIVARAYLAEVIAVDLAILLEQTKRAVKRDMDEMGTDNKMRYCKQNTQNEVTPHAPPAGFCSFFLGQNFFARRSQLCIACIVHFNSEGPRGIAFKIRPRQTVGLP